MSDESRLDRIIRAVAPEYALRRAASRIALSEIKNTYSGGIRTRTDRNWNQAKSINGGLRDERYRLGSMRDRARNVDRNNPIGRSILNTEVDNAVASGFTLQAKTSEKGFNRRIEEEFQFWADRADIRQMMAWSDLQRMAYRCYQRDGDVGIVLAKQGSFSRLQIIPGDRIQTPEKKSGDALIYDGVEVDSLSRPVAYHILSEDQNGKRDWTRIGADDFIFLSRTHEPLQVRGETCFSQIFPLLDQLDGYVDAVVIAARMAAVFGLVFKQSTGQRQLNSLPFMQNSQGQQQHAVTLENGMVKYVGPEDEVVQVQAQQPMNQTPDFIAAILRLIGMPFDMPLEIVAKDMSRVNLSSARLGIEGYKRAVRARQKTFSTLFLSRVYRWWLSREIKEGRITDAPDDLYRHAFAPVGWPYMDPVAEVQGDMLSVELGIKDPQTVCAERTGGDYMEVQERIALATETRKALGLPIYSSNMSKPVTMPEEADNGKEPDYSDDAV